MGLFDKLKHGLQGSGVHTEIDGPGWVSSDQPGIDLAISFTAKEEPAVLEGYVVTLAKPTGGGAAIAVMRRVATYGFPFKTVLH